jgi:hypothetical protein
MTKEFKLHEYPYEYTCDRCGKSFELSEEKERDLKRDYSISSGDPLFFRCKKCPSGLCKPVGYTGRESTIVFELSIGEIIKGLFKH